MKTMEHIMHRYGWYFFLLGIFGIVTALARTKNERELFLVLATIPTAFLIVRLMGFLSKKHQK
jgi:succinate-acetate transporter protein